MLRKFNIIQLIKAINRLRGTLAKKKAIRTAESTCLCSSLAIARSQAMFALVIL